MQLQSSIRNLAVALVIASGSAAHAAISYTSFDSTLTNDFSEYAGATGALPFSNDTTIPGFYAYISGGSSLPAGVPATIFGDSPAGPHPIYIFESTDGNVAVGSRNYTTNSVNNTGYIAFGFAYKNDTGEPITSFTFTYTPRLFLWGTNVTDSLTASYAVNATGVGDDDGTYTEIPGMGFTTTQTGGGTRTISGPTVTTVSDVSIAPGDTLFIRFVDFNVTNNGGIDVSMAVDDIAFSAIPEPTTMALFGLAGAGLLARRRKGR